MYICICIYMYIPIHLSIYITRFWFNIRSISIVPSPVVHAFLIHKSDLLRKPTLAFTRYCFTSQLYGGSRSSLHCPPPHQQRPPYCNTIGRPLRNIRPATDPPCLCHTSYNIGDGNIVLRPSCPQVQACLFCATGY